MKLYQLSFVYAKLKCGRTTSGGNNHRVKREAVSLFINFVAGARPRSTSLAHRFKEAPGLTSDANFVLVSLAHLLAALLGPEFQPGDWAKEDSREKKDTRFIQSIIFISFVIKASRLI